VSPPEQPARKISFRVYFLWKRIVFYRAFCGDEEMDKRQPIGVLDSGLGGVSVLRALRDLLPQENYLYFGDSANAPYGIKSEEEIRVLSFNVVEKLVAQGVKAIVIACNTITSAAVTALREKYTDLIIVGTEPAVKPAIFFRPRGKILVMATTATLQGTRFQALVQRWQGEATIIACPCPGLMEFVERGDTQSPELREYLTKKINSVKGWKADCVVLGCTHYPFVQNMIQELMGKKVRVFDGAPGVARQVERQLEKAHLLNNEGRPGEILWQNSSSDVRLLALGKKLLLMK